MICLFIIVIFDIFAKNFCGNFKIIIFFCSSFLCSAGNSHLITVFTKTFLNEGQVRNF